MQNETVKLQTNLMNNPVELLLKLEPDSQMYAGKLEFRCEDWCVGLVADRSPSDQLELLSAVLRTADSSCASEA